MSLRSIAQKGRFYCDWSKTPESEGNFQQSCLFVLERLRDRNTILVNAQSVWNDIVPPPEQRDDTAWVRLVDYPAIPRPKPAYEHMWLEAHLETPMQRFAAITTRCEVKGRLEGWFTTFEVGDQERQMIVEDNPATIVVVSLIHEYDGSVSVSGRCDYWLDAAGHFLRSARTYVIPSDKDGLPMGEEFLRASHRPVENAARMGAAHLRTHELRQCSLG
jgi:hypothetical protein